MAAVVREHVVGIGEHPGRAHAHRGSLLPLAAVRHPLDFLASEQVYDPPLERTDASHLVVEVELQVGARARVQAGIASGGPHRC